MKRKGCIRWGIPLGILGVIGVCALVVVILYFAQRNRNFYSARWC